MQDPPSGTVPGFVYMLCNGFREVMQNGREGNTLHVVPIRRVDGSPEGRTSLGLHCAIFRRHASQWPPRGHAERQREEDLACCADVWMAVQGVGLPFRLHCAIFRRHASQWPQEVMQNGSERKTLHAVPICGWQSRGSDFLQTSLCHFSVDMHHNGFREVMQNGREGKTLHVVHRFPSDFTVPGQSVML